MEAFAFQARRIPHVFLHNKVNAPNFQSSIEELQMFMQFGFPHPLKEAQQMGNH